jgi:hypothetical protein
VKVIPFAPEAESVLRHCDEAGVALDFVRVLPDVGEQSEFAHRLAALAAVAERREKLCLYSCRSAGHTVEVSSAATSTPCADRDKDRVACEKE